MREGRPQSLASTRGEADASATSPAGFQAGALDRFTIPVLIPAPLRRYCGGAGEIHVEGATVRQLLAELERTHPTLYGCVCDETGRVRRHVNLFVNSLHMRDCGGMDSALGAGDTVTVLPAVSGG